MREILHEVVFDGSTNPGTVVVNGTRCAFETDEEAKFIFDLLCRVSSQQVVEARKALEVERHLRVLVDLLTD